MAISESPPHSQILVSEPQPLLLAYDKTPCSACRCSCVESIRDLGEVPEWMIEECLNDAYSETRKLAAELKAGSV